MATPSDLRPGDPAPNFIQRSTSNPRFIFDASAGRFLLLCLFGSSADGHARAAIDASLARPDLFNDHRAAFFGITMDPEDEAGRIKPRLPGYRYMWDMDGVVGKAYGGLPGNYRPNSGWDGLARRWVLIDPAFRVVAVEPFCEDRSDIDRILALLEQHSDPEEVRRNRVPAPVLVLPRVFEPEFCRELMDYCNGREKIDSGYMVEEQGQTVLKVNHSHKIRRDCLIADKGLQERARMRVVRAIVPQIAKAFQFNATRIERYMVGCYTEEDSGFFNRHRDNTTRGTAHRRFAVSVLLNDDYEGGELRFAEFGNTLYKPPAGGALVFSCSLMHEVRPVTKGERFVFVPFLYDDAAAKVRDRNLKYVAEEARKR